MLKAAFVFLAPMADPKIHRTIIQTEAVHLITVGVDSYASAVAEVARLMEEEVGAIELCGGFGHVGTALIADVVGTKAALGVVKFDSHPGLGGKSGDEIF